MEHPVPIERLLRHREWLAALAQRLAAPSGGEDLEQETWVAALRNPPDRGRPVKPWLAAVTRRIAGRSRAKQAQRQAIDHEGSRAESLPDTAELIERIDTEKRLASEVQQLAEPYRTIVLLRYYDGLTSAEIASRQGVPAGTVRRQLKEGLEQLRQRLDRAFGERELWSAMLLSLAQATNVPVKSMATTSSASFGVLLLSAAIVAAVSIQALGRHDANDDPSPELASREPSALPASPAPEPAAVLATPASGREVAESQGSAAARSDTRKCVVRGRLVDEAGVPVAGASVTCSGWVSNRHREELFGVPQNWQNPDPVVSGEDGIFRFSFEPPAAFQFIVDVDHELYGKIGWRWGELEPGGEVDVGNAVLEPPGVLTGHIVDADGNLLIEGWKVMANLSRSERPRNSRNSHAEPDPTTGRFRIADLPPGRIRISAGGPYERRVEATATTEPGQEAEVQLVCADPVVEPGLRVRTKVRDFAPIQPEPGTVTAIAPDGTVVPFVRAASPFTWEAPVEPGVRYTIEITDPRFEEWRADAVGAGDRIRTDLVGSARVRMDVRDHADEPVSQYGLQILPDGLIGSSNNFILARDGSEAPVDGVFRGIVPGELTFVVRVPGYAPRQVLVHARAGQTVPVAVSLPDPTHRRRLSGRVVHADGSGARDVEIQITRGDYPGHDTSPGRHGSVTTDIDGRKAHVRVEYRDAKTTTDSEGRFDFGGLDPGPYALRAIANKWVQVDARFVVSNEHDGNDEALIQLPRFGDANITVLLPDSVEPESCRVSVNQLPRLELSLSSPALGPSSTCELKGVPVGTWRLGLTQAVLSGQAGGVFLGNVTIEEGVLTSVSFDVRQTLPVKITVKVTLNGAPADELIGVWAAPADEATENAPGSRLVQHQYDGITLAVLSPGRWTLKAGSQRGWIWAKPEILLVAPGQPFEALFDIPTYTRHLALANEHDGTFDDTEIQWETLDADSDDRFFASAIESATCITAKNDGSLGTLELPPGRYAFWPTDDPSRRVEIDWPADDTELIEIVLPPPDQER